MRSKWTRFVLTCLFVVVFMSGWTHSEVGTRAAKPALVTELPAGRTIPVRRKVFKDLQVIDHWNLRYYGEYDEFTLAEQVSQIKRNMDVAARLGFTSYLLFQEDAFPQLLTWGGRHKPDKSLQQAVQEVLNHATACGLKLYLHCNEFMWPDSVGVEYADTPQAWQTYRDALKELITLYPALAGFEVTADETSGALETQEGVLKFHNETARALCVDGRERIALMRTWQRVGILDSPTTLGKTDERNVLFSVKNTDGDFGVVKEFDDEFIDTVDDPRRLMVEFDAWREYETHNVFPIYLGDYWAPRFRKLAQRGVERIGVRFNWNCGKFVITERPWGNWVNVFSFMRLAEDPDANPDEILREYVALYYPSEARQAAFDLYKSSFGFVRDLYWDGREKITDHGRVNRQRKVADRRVPADWFARVDRLTDQMRARIDALPDEGAYKEELRRGASIVLYLSKACGLQLGAEGDAGFLAEWKQMDPVSFEELRGDNATEMVREQGSAGQVEPVTPSTVEPTDGNVYEAESPEVIGALVVKQDTKDDEFHEGATGDALVDFQEDSGESITWRTECGEGAESRLWFRYVLEEEDLRPLRLTANDQMVVPSMPFVDTGDWQSWTSISTETTLQKGTNMIRLESSGAGG